MKSRVIYKFICSFVHRQITYMNNGLLWAEAKPPDLVLVQFLDAQRQVRRGEPAADSAL